MQALSKFLVVTDFTLLNEKSKAVKVKRGATRARKDKNLKNSELQIKYAP